MNGHLVVVTYIIMHMKGTPQNMQEKTDYKEVTKEVIQHLAKKHLELTEYGINDIIVDPGFGFAKTVDQNFILLNQLELSQIIDSPLLVIPKNDCELTWDIFKDDVNCIMYDPKKLDTENLNILKSRIESLVNDESLSLKMRKNYFDSVSGNCSQFNASDYILKELKSIR